MGFLDHSTNNIIIDAVLTDLGRQALSQNDGSFSVVKFALGDDEIDYSLINKFGLTIGREKIEKNTPIFEAQTNSSLGLKYKLLSMSSQVETQLPSLVAESNGGISTNTDTLNQTGAGVGHAEIRLVQKIGTSALAAENAASTVPIDIQENVFTIKASSRFLTITDSNGTGLISDYVSQRDQMAMYRKTAGAIGGGNPNCRFRIYPKRSLNRTVYNTFGNAESVISTVVVVTGMLTGCQHIINVKLRYGTG